MKLIMITPFVGRSVTVWAFIPDWVRALAGQVENLYVITPHYEREDLPENVRVYAIGRDRQKGETALHALLKFDSVLRSLLYNNQIDGIFAHMFPKFALLAARYALPDRIPLILWFTHTHVSWQLRLAETLVDRIATTHPDTCRLNSPKVTPIGHGIDTRFFTGPGAEAGKTGNTLLAVGRISPVKELEVLVEAVGILVNQRGRVDLRLLIAGEPPNREGEAYLRRLKKLVANQQLEANVIFQGKVPYEQITRLNQQSDVLVSACNSGVDKGILEAMACELPVLISNPSFESILGPHGPVLMFSPGDAAGLAQRIENLLDLPAEHRREIGKQMRLIIQQDHHLDGLAKKIVDLFEQVKCHDMHRSSIIS